MKALTIITYVGAAGLAALAITMAQTNPDQPKYEEYAVQGLTKYLKSDVCKKTPNLLENLIKINCNKLVDSANPQIRELIAATTVRQNYMIFSVYSTDLKLNSWIPSYRFETVGAFGNFYTYSSEQQ
ncbi:DUF4359 domain-containing protein [Cylindrospermum sp. FACHB-282]|uniref:DUF4359 domain-containing protein n=1 Tax=Cylindrospermum sp. FACHB-282 TaxID=2692794 RepID=UPI001683B17B|nr:DUF4359 domain-containing protein [Cylindrospermum sp. FACHB-282]MBD2387673.1 DUF4359 domain-containing protein [Cylindrospermum sp. FACHB-282]